MSIDEFVFSCVALPSWSNDPLAWASCLSAAVVLSVFTASADVSMLHVFHAFAASSYM